MEESGVGTPQRHMPLDNGRCDAAVALLPPHSFSQLPARKGNKNHEDGLETILPKSVRARGRHRIVIPHALGHLPGHLRPTHTRMTWGHVLRWWGVVGGWPFRISCVARSVPTASGRWRWPEAHPRPSSWPGPPGPAAAPPVEPAPQTHDDCKNDPLIQKALEMFKGQIVDVRT